MDEYINTLVEAKVHNTRRVFSILPDKYTQAKATADCVCIRCRSVPSHTYASWINEGI